MILPWASGLVRQNHCKSIGFSRVASLPKTFKNLRILNDFPMGHKKLSKTAGTGRLDVGGGRLDVQNVGKSDIFGTFLERNPSRSSSIRQLSLKPLRGSDG